MLKNKWIKLIIIAAAVLFVFIVYDLVAYKNALSKPLNPKNETKTMFIIKNKENPKIVAQNLYNKKFISSAKYFYRYIKNSNKGPGIIAGGFLLSPSMTIIQITDEITNSSKNQYVFTVPEGYTIKDMDKKLTDMGLIKSNQFENAVKGFNEYEKYDFLDVKKLKKLRHPLEGYLFPDTYFIQPESFDPQDLIKKMLNNFGSKLTPELRQEMIRQNRATHDIVIMASLLEKEGRTKEEFETISGILWKRLANNWFLDVDAALLYETGNNTISSEDLNIDSPYNLRRGKKLPPGPVSNPGLKAIMAAMYPKQSPYWFYLTTPAGQTIYSKTNNEHNMAKAKYLR